MHLLACVDVPDLALQLLELRRRKPGGDPFAEEVRPWEIAEAVDEIAGRLALFTPEVERSTYEPGAFWLNAEGLEKLYGSIDRWAGDLIRNLEDAGFKASAAVGFTRFCTYALARAGHNRISIMRDVEQEERAAKEIRLELLGLPREAGVALQKLGIKTVGDLLSLPAEDLLERFGRRVYDLRLAADRGLGHPLQPLCRPERIKERVDIEPPCVDATRLVFAVKRMLPLLLKRASQRGEAVSELKIGLDMDRGAAVSETIRPAEPTLDEMQIIDLVRLRFESLRLDCGACGIEVVAGTSVASKEQLHLFATSHQRNPEAADRAFARLRAEFGRDVVFRARIAAGHLPEAGFRWEPLDRMPREKPNPADNGTRTMVRLFFSKPVPLQSRPICGPRGLYLRGIDQSPASRPIGSYVVSGGWWRREVHREYFFMETADGEILWVYFDRFRRRWFIQGKVE